MKNIERDFETIAHEELVFPLELEKDPWTLFHGTSSAYEPGIDRDGLVWKPEICSREDVLRLVSVFKSMNWLGADDGSVSNLTAYTLPRLSLPTPGVFFRKDPWECLGFCSKDMAGGETVTSVLSAIQALRRYLTDEETRREHVREQVLEFLDNVRYGFKADSPKRINLRWLEAQVQSLSSFEKRCRSLAAQHRYGVVYAVRFTEPDLARIIWSDTAGACFHGRVPKERVVAKCRVLHLTTHRSIRGRQAPHLPRHPRNWREETLVGRLWNKSAPAQEKPSMVRDFWGEADADPGAGQPLEQHEFDSVL